MDKDVFDLDAVPMAYILMKARYISLHIFFQEKVKDIQPNMKLTGHMVKEEAGVM